MLQNLIFTNYYTNGTGITVRDLARKQVNAALQIIFVCTQFICTFLKKGSMTRSGYMAGGRDTGLGNLSGDLEASGS